MYGVEALQEYRKMIQDVFFTVLRSFIYSYHKIIDILPMALRRSQLNHCHKRKKTGLNLIKLISYYFGAKLGQVITYKF